MSATRELAVRWAYADGDIDWSDAHYVAADADHATIVAFLVALADDSGDTALEYRTADTDEAWTPVQEAEWPQAVMA